MNLTFYIILCCLSPVLFAQNDSTIMKAAFMERFTRFVEWPDQKDINRPFRVLILGDNPFGGSLEEMFSTIKIKKRDVEVLYSYDVSTIEGCQIVYVSSSMEEKLDGIRALAQKHNVLSIGDTEGFGKMGVMINFFVEAEMLRFEINTGEFRKTEMRVSPLLLNVSKQIKSHPTPETQGYYLNRRQQFEIRNEEPKQGNGNPAEFILCSFSDSHYPQRLTTMDLFLNLPDEILSH